jgi:hypothetical protein
MASNLIKEKAEAGFRLMVNSFGRELTLRVFSTPTDYDPETGTYTQGNTDTGITGVVTVKRKSKYAPEYLPDPYYKVMVRQGDLEGLNIKLGDVVIDGSNSYRIKEILSNPITTLICEAI